MVPWFHLSSYSKRHLDRFSRVLRLTVVTNSHLRCANRHLLAVSRFRLNTYGRRAFSVAGPMAWNSLPDFIPDPTSSTDCFRRLLKRTCSRVTSASRALGVINDYALYKSTHSLTQAHRHTDHATSVATGRILRRDACVPRDL